MNTQPVKFNGTAGGYFVAALVEIVTAYIFIIGWPIGFNFVANWVVSNVEIEGKRMKYSAGYGETLGFLLVNILLILITLGIYAFWFVPKSYRYVVDHTSYEDSAPLPQQAEPAPAEQTAPADSAPLVQ